jgi:hypothetical protein
MEISKPFRTSPGLGFIIGTTVFPDAKLVEYKHLDLSSKLQNYQ